MKPPAERVVAFSGGVGGARLVLGLSRLVPGEGLLVVANTGDDFEHLGLDVAPDLDTLMYTLAGLADPDTGWGRAGETWAFMSALAALGGEGWFRLGDGDLATHVERTRRLARGETLSAITADFCRRLGVGARLLPMSDQPVRTMVETEGGELAFQRYFVERRCAPEVRGFRFAGLDRAHPHPEWFGALARPDTVAAILCPSNPFISIDPILALPGVREALRASPAPVHDLSLRRAQPAPPESPKAPAAVPKSPAIATWFSRPAASKKRATASSGPRDGEGTSNPASAEAGPTPADPRELRGVPVAQAAVSKTAAPTATTASTRTVGNAFPPLGRLAPPSVRGARAARTAGSLVTQPHLPTDPPPL